jgi:glycine C-acetyltransferase
MTYDAKVTQIFASKLQQEGVFVTGFSYPVVPDGQARIRVQLSAIHKQEQLRKAVEAFEKVGRELKVIN